MTPEEAARVVGLSAGDGYTEARLEEAQRALDAQYRARGYNRVTIDYQARTVEADAASRAATDVDVVVRVDEGPQQRLREVVTSGVSRTRPGIVSRALALEVGAPVNLAAWNAARRRAYETGAFRGVDIQREVIDASSPRCPAKSRFGPGSPCRNGRRCGSGTASKFATSSTPPATPRAPTNRRVNPWAVARSGSASRAISRRAGCSEPRCRPASPAATRSDPARYASVPDGADVLRAADRRRRYSSSVRSRSRVPTR